MPARGRIVFQAATAEESDGYYFCVAARTVEAERIDDVPRVLAAVDDASENGCYAAGYVAYEAGAAFEQAMPRRSLDMPYAWFGIYDEATRISRAEAERLMAGHEAEIEHLRFSVPAPRYRKQVEAIRSMIREGDVYQINYTGQLRFDLRGPAEALYRRLVQRQPVPYAAFIDTGAMQILSCSPELFFRRRGSRITTRPMKGTARRGETAERDDEIASSLAADAKNRAENLMIVDLLRNDLSKCCLPGSVRTPKLFETERYETLIQMSSEVEGELLPSAGLTDIFEALFPCGSVTGAPKIRAMQRIDELEDEARGVYCGAVGFVAPGGDAVFNVAIRTAVVDRGIGRLGIGSGIVWDSEAGAEFEESLLKARFLTGDHLLEEAPFYLIETMRADEGVVPLLDLHLDRLSASADHFGIPFHRSGVAGLVERDLRTGGAVRVRLTLHEDGSVHVDSAPAGPPPKRWRVAISGTRIDSKDPLRRHKTSRRALYGEKYERALELGCDEVLFLNERNEVAEGSRSNVFVRTGRRWRTPPVESGALPGVYRRRLLETIPGLREEVLYIGDLLAADAVYVSNAVAGLVEADIVRHDGRGAPGDAASASAEASAAAQD